MNFRHRIKRTFNRKFRFIIVDHRNFEEIASFSSSFKQTIIRILGIFIVFFIITAIILRATNFYQYFFPERATEYSEQIKELYLKVDSIEQKLEIKSLYLSNFQKFLKNEDFDEQLLTETFSVTHTDVDNIDWNVSDAERELRNTVLQENK